MGVHGLWDLLSPVGRRVSVETLAGKRLAIDASIWMVQFMKAMRDERGEMVRNAHLIGFFRRICKLLFLRIKPVFVFDGGTPALKRRTVIARRRQRENAQAKVRKTAEKLLLNQVKAMRLKELADNLQNQKEMNNSKDKNISKGKEVMLEKSDSLEKIESESEGHNQEMVDEMLAASIAAEESGDLGTASSCAAEIGSSSGKASSTASGFPREDEEDEDDEEMILPISDGKVDPAVLAALPPSMQLDLLVQMRERLMAENRQKYQRVKKAPQNFSELQIEAYLKTVAFRREIDQVQKAAAGKGVGGVQMSRIASESNREFIFSSSFSGDKQLLASGGAAKIPENELRGEKKDFSFDILNAMTSVTKSSTEAEPANGGVKTFTDETGCRRVSKRTAMGIRMTRDLQRNIDLMKEFEQETTPVNNETNVEVNPDMDRQSEGSHCYGKSFEAANEFSCDTVQNSIVNSSLNPKMHKDVQMNESCIEISFEDDGRQSSLDNDDEFFAHLVAGDPIPTCAEDDSISDCEWEDVVISRESGSLTDGNKLKSDSFHVQDVNDNESDVEWEEVTNSEEFSMKSSDAEGSKDKDIGDKWHDGHVDNIHEDDRLFAADFQKIVSKGSAEEEAALQEAIKRSLEDSRVGASGAEEEADFSDLSFNMQMQLKSCSSLPRSQGESVLDDYKQSQSFVSEYDQFGFAAEKVTNASSSLGMYSTPVPCVTAETIPHLDMKDMDEQQRNAVVENAQFNIVVKDDSSAPADIVPCLPGPITENFVDDVATNGGASVYNSGEAIEHSTGKKISVMEEQTLHSDVKVTVGEDDASPGSLQKPSHDVEISSFKEKENALESLGSSFEDELLVLGEEYKNLGDEQRKLERNADSVNAEMFVECQELLQMFGLPYIIAPMEAEAQCAFLELANLVDGVVTDDSDVFLFGAKSVYKNIFDDRKYVETYLMKDIESELGLDREKLIRMALLLGSDYTEGVSGIGIVNAIEVVNAFPEEDGLHKFRDWIESPDPAILGKVGGQSGMSSKKKGAKPSRNDDSKSDAAENSVADSNILFEHEDDEIRNDIQKTKQTFMNKHRNVSKNWHVPSSFPSDAVISAYLAPQVDKSNEPFAWGKPDIFSLRKLCWEKFAWASQKADELLLPVLKEYNKHETQLRLEAFYTFNERFAKIRSKRIQKAVKGIVGKPYLDLDVADDLQDNSAEREKTEERAGGNRRKRSHLKRKDHVGERENSTKKLKSQQDNGDRNEGLPTEAENTGLHTKADRQSMNNVGSSRGRGRGSRGGRGRRKSIKSSRQKENFDSECGATSISSGDEDEHEVLAGNINLPDSVRRSKRVRQAANYLEQDEKTDGPATPLNSKKKKCSDAKADEQGSSLPIVQEAQMTNATIAKEFQSDDRPEHGSPGNHLVKGAGFCAEDAEAEAEAEAEKETHREYLQMGGGFCAEEEETGKESHSEYLQMGGGFCVEDEDDLDFRECGSSGGPDITDAYITCHLTDVRKAGPTINPRETVAASTSVPDSVQQSEKGPSTDSRLNLGDKHEATESNPSNVAAPVANDAPTNVNPFSAIPLMKKKKRKT